MGKTLVITPLGTLRSSVGSEAFSYLHAYLKKKKKKLTWIPQSFYTRRRIETRPTVADAVAGYFRCSGEFESWQTFQQFWSFQSRKEKTFNKGMGAKKEKKKSPDERKTAVPTPTTSSVREQRQQPRLVILPPASESTLLSSYPIYMSKTQVCSVWAIPGSGWEAVPGEKLVRLRGNFFKPKTTPAALSRSESSGEFCFFFPLCPC